MKKLTGFLVSSLFLISAVWAADDSLTDMERLGKRIYKDTNMSYYGTQSCRDCHHHTSGFADLTNYLDPDINFVSTGADGVSKGGRNAPSAAYAGFSPPLYLNEDGDYVGGMFWDGRADGSVLGDPLAEQAQGPPLNPKEMAMPSKEAVIQVIRDSDYLNLWNKIFGRGSLDNLETHEEVDAVYNNFGIAIATYERSIEVTKFTSKFDRGGLSKVERTGQALFEANCAICHSTTEALGAPAALFTNYQYANIGVPVNPGIDAEDPDLGLGVIKGSAQDGKFKIPTLRNIALTPPYSHNGVFPTLIEMLKFINDSSGFTPEVPYNLSTEVGSIGLSDTDLEKIEAFLMTLTDD